MKFHWQLESCKGNDSGSKESGADFAKFAYVD